MEKILIEIYDCYGNSGEVQNKRKNFVIDSISKLEEGLTNVDYGWLAELGDSCYEDFANGNVESAVIEYSGDWDDPVAYKLVRYSYDKKMKELEEFYKIQKDELNKLFEN